VLVPSVPAFEVQTDDPFSSESLVTGEVLINPLFFNYPWQHAGENGSLTITFEEECSKELQVELDPNTVQPRGVANTQATVDARVTTCPPTPGSTPESVVVTFTIDPNEPVQGSEDAGGHSHNGNRPRGNFTVPKTGPTAVMCTVSTFDAQGVGTCDEPKTYFPPEVSGNVKIVAEAKDFDKAEKRINVQVPGLIPLEEVIIPTFFRLTGRTSTHFDNHYGTENTVDKIVAMAFDYFDLHNETIGINDMSLISGGLFDIRNNWSAKPGHSRHRLGKSVDIDRCA